MRTVTVTESGLLLPLMIKSFPDLNRTKLKQLLKFGSVAVNGKPAQRHDDALNKGDTIALLPYRPQSKRPLEASLSFPIVFEDERLIVIDKPTGLLTMGTEKEKVRTAYFELTAYARAKSVDGQGRVFIVHRLDRDASGLVVFAKDETMKRALQKNWNQAQKLYYAIVEGKPKEATGVIKSHLAESKSFKVYSTHASEFSKPAETFYRVLATKGRYSMLEVKLLTGRKNQIRVHMSDLGNPLIGDEKYGAKSDPAGRLGLHAFGLEFNDPETGVRHAFKSHLPEVLKLDRLR